MFSDSIKNFPKQFAYQPEIKNAAPFLGREIFIILGMGGSHLAADLIAAYKPEADIIVYSDYGLNFPESVLASALIVASSYSGNTEEVIDGFETAVQKNLAVAVIATGGKLIELAQKHQKPYIELHNTGIQPREALGFSLRALLKIMGDEKTLKETESLAESLRPEEIREKAQSLANRLKGHIPVIYTSQKKASVGYIWKIKLNETGKVPAFCNVVPEMNHNEINSFEVPALAEKFYFLFLEDSYDHPRVQKRMSVAADLFVKKGLKVEKIKLSGENHFHKIFSSLILADWVSFYLAEQYGLDPEQVPMVEEFKKLIS